MIIAILLVLGLCLGSFVNALVWRVHEQALLSPKSKARSKTLSTFSLRPSAKSPYSILYGRSMCPHCKHSLKTADLVPVLSWLSLRSRCRYCHQLIAVQYPLVEIATGLLFVASYIWWPPALQGSQLLIFGLWLILLVGFMALIVYDLRWYLLPNRIIYPLSLVAALLASVRVATADDPLRAVVDTALAVAVGGGIFYILFQLSSGKWIGGGDVKLGWLLGLVAGTPARSLLFIFLAALLGTLVSLPLLLSSRLKRNSTIPFGPFLIVATMIVQLFGASVLNWYQHTLLHL